MIAKSTTVPFDFPVSQLSDQKSWVKTRGRTSLVQRWKALVYNCNQHHMLHLTGVDGGGTRKYTVGFSPNFLNISERRNPKDFTQPVPEVIAHSVMVAKDNDRSEHFLVDRWKGVYHYHLSPYAGVTQFTYLHGDEVKHSPIHEKIKCLEDDPKDPNLVKELRQLFENIVFNGS